MFRTLTLNPSLDAEYRVPRMKAGRVLRVGEPRVAAGGKGLNVARHLARLGGSRCVTAHCLLGGATGERILQRAQAEGLLLVPTRHRAESRTNLLIAESQGRREFKLNAAGPTIPRRTVDACIRAFLEAILPGDVAVISGSLPPGADAALMRRIVSQASRRGAEVWVDAEGEALQRALEGGPCGLKPNREEFRLLGGIDPARVGEGRVVAAARVILESAGARELLLSLGRAGAMWVGEAGQVRREPPSLAGTAQALGAGDALLAAWLHHRSKHLPPAAALGEAVAYVSGWLSGESPAT